MVKASCLFVFSLLQLLLFLGAPWGSRGVAPHSYGSYNSLCHLGACQCPRSNDNIHCECNHKIQEIVLRASGYDFLPNTTGLITINKCTTVTVTKGSILNIRPLRSITLTNIAQLQLEEEAFFWGSSNQENNQYPGIDILIANASISVLPSHAFKGHLNSISLRNVNVSTIKALAFADTGQMEKIEITNSNIEMVAPQAFRKIVINYFIVEGGRIGLLPSNSMNSLQIINELKFENVNFDSIRSSALKVTEPKVFRLRSCNILQLEGEAFQITTTGPIFIDDNVIQQTARGAFAGIHLYPRWTTYSSGKQELVFENNTLTNFEENALLFNTSGIKPRIDRIVINKPCTCPDIKIWSTKLVKFTTAPVDGNIAKLIWCHKGKNDMVLFDYERKSCITNTSRVYMVITILIIVLISLICICSLGFWLFRKHAKRYMNVPTNEGNNRLSVLSTTSNHHIIVIPESKIYRETELNVMTECAEPIKEYVLPQAISHPA